MKSSATLAILFALISIVSLTNTAEAATATLITPHTALFTIDYAFTAELGDQTAPIMASSTVGYFDRVDVLGYNLTNQAGGTVTPATVNGLVLSGASVSDARYAVGRDTTERFTLVVLATFAEEIDEDITATITKIPYWVGERRTTVHEFQLDDLATATLTVE